MSSEVLTARFFEDPALRVEWSSILTSRSWKAVREIVRTAAVEAAAAGALSDHDVIAARRSFKLQAVMETLAALDTAARAPAVPPVEPVPWEHIVTNVNAT